MDGAYYKIDEYQVRRSVGHLIRAASAQVTAQVEAIFQGTDITFIQYVILMYLRDDMAKTPAELCQKVRYDSGALSRVLDQLEERGFLVRTRCTQDRRVVKLHITPEGRGVVEALMPKVVGLYNTWLADFTSDEADTLVALLAKFNAAIATHSERKE